MEMLRGDTPDCRLLLFHPSNDRHDVTTSSSPSTASCPSIQLRRTRPDLNTRQKKIKISPNSRTSLIPSRATPSFKYLNFLSCAAAFLFVLLLQIALTSSSTSTSLKLGILVAESCDTSFLNRVDAKINQAISDFKSEVQDTESNPVTLDITLKKYPFCSTREAVSSLDAILSDASIHAVLALSTYDVHSSFVPLAEIYGKAYITVNSFVPVLAKNHALSFSPTFSQQSLMLAKILDMYRWQSIYVVSSNFNYWVDFETAFYFEMTSQEFKVKLAKAVTSPLSIQDASNALEMMKDSKAIVLLMDVTDQLTMLEAASSMSMTKDHAYFSFAKTPYDFSVGSSIGVTSEQTSESRFSNDSNAIGVNIFESLFVISASFPEAQTENGSMVANRRRKRQTNDNFYVDKQTFSDLRPSGKRNGHSLYVNREATHHGDKISHFNGDVSNSRGQPERPLEYEVNSVRSIRSNVGENVIDGVHNLFIAIPSKSEDGSQNTRMPMPHNDNPSHALARGRSTHLDDIIRRHLKPISTSQTSNIPSSGSNDKLILDASDIESTSSRLHSSPSDLSNPPVSSKQQNHALLFVSESHPSQSEVLSDHAPPRQLSNLRIKRDLETYTATDADLEGIYDAVYLLSLASYRQAQSSGSVPFYEEFIEMISNLTFNSGESEFRIDSDQKVSYDFAVYDFNASSGVMEPRIFHVATSSEEWELNYEMEIKWPGGVKVSGDECFKQIPNCNEGLRSSIIAVIVIAAFAFIVIIIVVFIFIRRHWVNKEMTRGPNKVILSSEDLVFVLKKDMGKGSRIMKSRATLMDKDNAPDLIRGSHPNQSMASINELSDYTETARYNGDLVHVKELDIKGFEMRSKLLTFIRMCRDLRHENLNPYVGFLADPVRPSLVMEYCSRGSLNDIIHNDDFKLDWDFKLSLLTDLVRGVRYLHSSALKFHGHMTSKNCVIDSRFVLKITDYGVSGIMERCKAFKEYEPRDLLWSAPELLRDDALLQRGTEKGDLYAMSIIFQEVALRTEPYSTTGLTPEEVVKKLKKPPPLIRPSVTPQAAPPQFIQIMKQCWSEMPEMRPSIDDVYDQFKKLTGGKKANIVDTMFKMLEKYSTDLEDIVAERTVQLEEEKKKTDQLLFRMLPPTVAESLKIGRNVEAECFDEVTIYFSDIVGFTTISAMSTPMQVVDLLNDLYTMFDATINDHDVYKVETIGDAYMVVSGLPVRNGNRHAGEIGTMALVLLSQCGKFTIRHMPHVPLRLRIGLHTGSCVAGVVGLTMPRFCLFGDTVNTASRMESTGAAFRIHLSETCKVILDELGGYKIEYRGKTELKGKGIHNTYWLVGKEGFDLELPEPPPLVGDNTHGLDSILGDQKLDPQAELNPPISDSTSKSNSAPNLATPTSSPTPKDDSALNNANQTSSSHPTNLDEVHKNNCKQSKNNNISIVTADINLTVGGAKLDVINPSTNETTGPSLEGVTDPCQSRHSESNDSGFGSERKHSQGNDGFPSSGATTSGNLGSVDKVKRSQQNRTSVVSSTDITLHNNHVMPTVDVGEELTPVTEV